MSIRLANTTINLPTRNLPKRIGAALEKAHEVLEGRRQAWVDRETADVMARHAEATEPDRLARALLDGTDASATNPIQDAQAAAEEAQKRINVYEAAERLVLTELYDAMDAEAKAWAASARTRAGKAVTGAVTALRMLEDHARTLRDDIGTLTMLRDREGGSASLSPAHGRTSHIFAMEAGLAGIRQAISEASSELNALKRVGTGEHEPVENDEADDDD